MNVKAIFHRQTKAAFRAEVINLAKLQGWRCWYVSSGGRSCAGWPDLVLIRRPRIVFLELKAERTPVTADQKSTIAALRSCGLQAHIVRPSEAQKIERLLR